MTSAASPVASPLAVGILGAGHRPADLSRLLDVAQEPGLLDGLRAALGIHAGSGTGGPTADEIVGLMAAVTAAILGGRFPAGAAGSLLHPAAHRDIVAWGQAWPALPEEEQAWLPARPNVGGYRPGARGRPAVLPADGQICGLFAVDIAGFTSPHRDDDIRRYLHEELYTFLEKAFDESGIPWAECCWEDRGDGALIVVPPGIPCQGLIDPLPGRLRRLIRRHNHVSREAAAIQLRAAAHVGPVEHDGHGFVGSDVNLLFRMLEARSFKRTLAGCGGELALIVSEYVYRSLVCRYPSLVHPDTFRTARFQVKQTRFRAWTYLPGGGEA